jgi:hypothetical protein
VGTATHWQIPIFVAVAPQFSSAARLKKNGSRLLDFSLSTVL